MKADIGLFSLWAKTESTSTDIEPSFHPLVFHLLDVAACAEALLQQEAARVQQLANLSDLNSEDFSLCVVTLIALHDIGKCACGFQGKALDVWPDYLGPSPTRETSVRHDAAGLWLFHENAALKEIAGTLLPGLEMSERTTLIQAVAGHHGQPIEKHGKQYPDIGNEDRQIGAKGQDAAVAITESIVALLGPKPCSLAPDSIPLTSFWLAGLTVLADWLGSNRAWFPFQAPPQDGDFNGHVKFYWENRARPNARRAIKEAGLIAAQMSLETGIAALFGEDYMPTPLQRYAQDVGFGDGPALFIIEDMTGAGKTEAAVVLAHRLMLAGKARGLHVGLPTMATANAMFERLAKNYRKMFAVEDRPSIVLTHGRRDLFAGFVHLPDILAHFDSEAHDDDNPSNIEASAFCADWLARSNKQAFLAQVGAGTIDQEILSVLPVRHQCLRLWGLADRVLVIDEAHAYDAYMSKEIERLLEFQAGLGGSAVVLSATLTQAKRAALVAAFREGLDGENLSEWRPEQSAYPLATAVAAGHVAEKPLDLRASLAREVSVARLGSLDEAYARALEAARRGAAIAVIRNTVNEAIESFETLTRMFEGEILLFHARFAMVDRQRIEDDVLQRFGKNGSEGRNAILVATQVIEQSLDIDFDLIISDLAPVDLLIQRAGRLWRHERGPRPIDGPSFLVFSPEPTEEVGRDWPAPLLPKTASVYKNQAVLWRSAKAIFAAKKIVSRTSAACASPESGEVRALVEAAYDDEAALPVMLESAKNKAMGAEYGERSHADFRLLQFRAGYDWQDMKWGREEKARTRLNEPTITLRLARIEQGRGVPWAPIEAGDERGAWALSEVNLRQSQCVGEDNPPEVKALVEAAKVKWSVSEKDMAVVVLSAAEKEGEWQAQVLDGKQKSVRIAYSERLGFKWVSASHIS